MELEHDGFCRKYQSTELQRENGSERIFHNTKNLTVYEHEKYAVNEQYGFPTTKQGIWIADFTGNSWVPGTTGIVLWCELLRKRIMGIHRNLLVWRKEWTWNSVILIPEAQGTQEETPRRDSQVPFWRNCSRIQERRPFARSPSQKKDPVKNAMVFQEQRKKGAPESRILKTLEYWNTGNTGIEMPEQSSRKTVRWYAPGGRRMPGTTQSFQKHRHANETEPGNL